MQISLGLHQVNKFVCLLGVRLTSEISEARPSHKIDVTKLNFNFAKEHIHRESDYDSVRRDMPPSLEKQFSMLFNNIIHNTAP